MNDLVTCELNDEPHARWKTCINPKPAVIPLSRWEWIKMFAACLIFAIVVSFLFIIIYVLLGGGG